MQGYKTIIYIMHIMYILYIMNVYIVYNVYIIYDIFLVRKTNKPEQFNWKE
jgi:hypothetical protein